MSLINFKLGTPEDLAFASYDDGTVYFVFPSGSTTVVFIQIQKECGTQLVLLMMIQILYGQTTWIGQNW